MRKMTVIYPNPCVLWPSGHIDVLWGLSELTLSPMGSFCDVILRRAALGTKFECLVWALLNYMRSVYREFAPPFWSACRIWSCWKNCFERGDILAIMIPSGYVGCKIQQCFLPAHQAVLFIFFVYELCEKLLEKWPYALFCLKPESTYISRSGPQRRNGVLWGYWLSY